MVTDLPMRFFSLARLKAEGSPMHPDDLTWEHGEECAQCWARRQRQLEAYNNYWKNRIKSANRTAENGFQHL